ncbi:hypothetical protein IMY05_015G0056400 [Salix suchowensis]|nr:hypothetical protein IMY05_015G0056400 [Salix suchowensis]
MADSALQESIFYNIIGDDKGQGSLEQLNKSRRGGHINGTWLGLFQRFHDAGCTEFTATWETQSERGRCFRQWLSCSPKSIIQSTPYVTGITDTEKLADSDWNRE